MHHLTPRAEGGEHPADNCCLTCFAHHRAAHAGRLVISGTIATGLAFAHADGRPYGAPRLAVPASPAGSDPATEDAAIQALRQLGFTLVQSRAAVVAARSHVGPSTTLEDVIRRRRHVRARGQLLMMTRARQARRRRFGFLSASS